MNVSQNETGFGIQPKFTNAEYDNDRHHKQCDSSIAFFGTPVMSDFK